MPEGEATLIAMVVPTPASPIPCQARPTYSSPLLSINYCCSPRFLPFPPQRPGKILLFFPLFSPIEHREKGYSLEDIAHFRASFFLFFFSFSPPNIFSRFKTRNTKDKVVHDTRYRRNYVCERGNFLIDRVFNRVAVLRQGNQ